MSRENERRARELAHELWQKWIAYENDNALKWDELGVPALVQALDEAEAGGRPQWRPVSERPADVPTGWAPFLCYSPGEDIRVCWYSTSNGWQWSGPSGETVITYWMPLPSPPTPTTEEG